MQLDELKAILRAWGHATVNRHSMQRSERTTIHVLTKVRDHAPGTRERAERELVGRDGGDRRRRMAQSVGIRHLTILPMWACDPIPAANDADRPHDNPVIAVDIGIPDDLRGIESAVIALERQHPIRGLVLRTEYTVSASQRIKARMVAETYGGRFTLDMYRRELRLAVEVIGWWLGRAA